MTIMPTGRSFEVSHIGIRPPTMNDTLRLGPYARAKVIKEWRTAFYALARKAKAPHLDLAIVSVTPLHSSRRSPQDCAACAPAAKAGIDGLVDAGVLDDDDPTHLHAVHFHQPEVGKVDGLRLAVLEVADVATEDLPAWVDRLGRPGLRLVP